MRSVALRGRRPLAALAMLVAVLAPLLPAPGEVFAAGMVAAAMALVIVTAASTFAMAAVSPAGIRAGIRARAVLERLVPRAVQSDPDARGHARPRAPGALLPAV